MIIRSSLLRRREDVSTGEFYAHFRDVQGPLAAKIPNAVAYKQNHRVRRWDLPEATFLPRVDAFSQIWFPDVHTMMSSMAAAEQAVAYRDFALISDAHTTTVQRPGLLRGRSSRGETKLTLVLVGDAGLAPVAEDELFALMDRRVPGRFTLRVNPTIPTGDSTPVRPALAAFAEIWVDSDTVADELFESGLMVRTGPLQVCTAMLVNEFVLIEGPES